MTFRDPFHHKLFCDSMKENWKHMATLFKISIIILFIPQHCPLLMFIQFDYLHGKIARLSYVTVLPLFLWRKERNNRRMFLFSNMQISTAGWISRFMAENISDQYLYQVSLENVCVYIYKVKAWKVYKAKVGVLSLMQ